MPAHVLTGALQSRYQRTALAQRDLRGLLALAFSWMAQTRDRAGVLGVGEAKGILSCVRCSQFSPRAQAQHARGPCHS